MRTFSILLLSLSLASAPGLSLAAEELKIAVVDLARLMDEAPQGEAVAQALREEFANREREILGKRRELEALYEKRERDGEIMSEQELYELNRDISQKNRILSRRENEYREDYSLRRNEEISVLQRLIVQEVQAFSEEEDYDLVLGDGVLYSSGRAEITEEILGRLEAEASRAQDGG